MKYNEFEIVAHPELKPEEKETHISIDRMEVSETGRMKISTFDRIVVEHLVKSPNFAVINTHYCYVDGEICIYGIEGYLPLGHLRIKQDCKTPDNISFILSKQF